LSEVVDRGATAIYVRELAFHRCAPRNSAFGSNGIVRSIRIHPKQKERERMRRDDADRSGACADMELRL
jgi:hypothetical protein